MIPFSSLRRRALMAGIAGAGLGAALPSRSRANDAATLNIVQPWEIKSLVPRESGYTWTRAGVSETLVAIAPDGTLAPGLATAWTVSEDARTWRFALRHGVTFHDGTPADAAAVLDALRRLAPRSLYLSQAGVERIEAEADAIVVRTAEPNALIPTYLTDNALPILARASFDAAGEVSRVIATGPFRVEATDLPRRLRLARHEAYWGTKPAFPHATFQAVTHGDTRANIAIAGEADLVFNLPMPAVARVAAAGRAAIDRSVTPRVHILMPNVAQPQFADVRVRRALSAAIDRRAIATSIMRNPALAATTYLPPTFKEWTHPELAPLSFDVALANRLLDEAGWTRGPDGIRMKDGRRFAGTVKTFVNRPELPVIAASLQDQLRQVGFALAVKIGDWTEIYEAQRDGTLELGLSSRNVAVAPDPVATIGNDFTGDVSPGGAVGATNWKSQALRDAVAAYGRTVESSRLTALRRQMVSILQDELPVIPICWYEQIVAVRSDATGFVNDPFDQRYYLEQIRRRA